MSKPTLICSLQHPYSSIHTQTPTTPLFTPPPLPNHQTNASQTFVFSCSKIVAQSQRSHNRDTRQAFPRPWNPLSSSNQSGRTPSQHPSSFSFSSSSSQSRTVSTSTLRIQSSSTHHHSFSSPYGSQWRPVPSLGSGPGSLAGKISDPISVSGYTLGPGPSPPPSTSNGRSRTRRESGKDKSIFFFSSFTNCCL